MKFYATGRVAYTFTIHISDKGLAARIDKECF